MLMPQNDKDLELMKKAIDYAKDCLPSKPSIPRVGAIIAVGGQILSLGRRGTGKEHDDEHAEWNAFEQIKDKPLFATRLISYFLTPTRTNPYQSPKVGTNTRGCSPSPKMHHQESTSSTSASGGE